MLGFLLGVALATSSGASPDPLRPDAPDTARTALAPSPFTELPGIPPYWIRREVVYVEATTDSAGKVWRAEIVASHAHQAVADSLRLLVLGWRFPPRPGRALLAFAGDRTESRAGLDGGRVLPEDVRAALGAGALRPWMDGWREVDPRFAVDDFVAWDVGRMALATEPGALALEPSLKVDRGGPRSEDPTTGLGWYGHEAGLLAESRYAAVHARTGERSYYRFATDQDLWLAVWTSPNRFAAVGLVQVLHPTDAGVALLAFDVPAVWVGDITTGTVERYLGAPVAHPNRFRLLELRGEFLRQASGFSGTR